LRGHRKDVNIRISNVQVSVCGDMAFVTCEEHVGTDERTGRVAATNVFEQQNGIWKMIHHHGSIISSAFRNLKGSGT
jgi:ketosteroid isomerase-like protein